MDDLKIGQVLMMELPFEKNGKESWGEHPNLIVDIRENHILIIPLQTDPVLKKPWVLRRPSQILIPKFNPYEHAIKHDSVANINTRIFLERIPELMTFRRTTETLSEKKLKYVINKYYKWQMEEDRNKTYDPKKRFTVTRQEILQHAKHNQEVYQRKQEIKIQQEENLKILSQLISNKQNNPDGLNNGNTGR